VTPNRFTKSKLEYAFPILVLFLPALEYDTALGG
jgi:hypothetical protein